MLHSGQRSLYQSGTMREVSDVKKSSEKMDDSKKMFREDAEDDGYKRYKHLAYCKLAIKAFLFFFLGVLICHLLGG